MTKEFGPMLNQEFILRLWSVAELNSFSSLWKSTSRRQWSYSILENRRRFLETFFAWSSLVWRQVEEKYSRRRKQEHKSVLNWFIRNNSVFPRTSSPFRTQYYWFSYKTMCSFCTILRVHSSCRMCNEFTFHHQFWIVVLKIKNLSNRPTVFFLLGSHGQKPQGSWFVRLEWTASCTIYA